MTKKIKIEVVTSQHDRDPGEPEPVILTGKEIAELGARMSMNRVNDPCLARLEPARTSELSELGMTPWTGPGDWIEGDPEAFKHDTLWLFPAEWYDYIGNGQPVVDIFGESLLFKHGVTDDDRRFGYLSFGFLMPEEALS